MNTFLNGLVKPRVALYVLSDFTPTKKASDEEIHDKPSPITMNFAANPISPKRYISCYGG